MSEVADAPAVGATAAEPPAKRTRTGSAGSPPGPAATAGGGIPGSAPADMPTPPPQAGGDMPTPPPQQGSAAGPAGSAPHSSQDDVADMPTPPHAQRSGGTVADMPTPPHAQRAGGAGTPQDVSDMLTPAVAPAPAAARPGWGGRALDFADWRVGARYRLRRTLGRGSYGEVAEALQLDTDRRVAIKRIVGAFEQEVDAKRVLRELYILGRLRHPNVIELLDIVEPPPLADFKELYLVFEFVDTDLYKLILSPQYLSTAHIQMILYQLLQGLQFVHGCSVIHRDIKPANILLNEDCSLKICDFGLARVFSADPVLPATPVRPADAGSSSSSSKPPPATALRRQLTKHVVTRWYRSPELILLQDYTAAVDMWSVGCIFAELLSMQQESVPRYQDRRPLFPGKSCFPLSADMPTTYEDKRDQLNVIFDVIGTPREEDIGSLSEVRQYLRELPAKPARPLHEVYPGAEPAALALLRSMLEFNHERRISVADALQHEFLASARQADDLSRREPAAIAEPRLVEGLVELKKRVWEEVVAFRASSAPSALSLASLAPSPRVLSAGVSGGGKGSAGTEVDPLASPDD